MSLTLTYFHTVQVERESANVQQRRSLLEEQCVRVERQLQGDNSSSGTATTTSTGVESERALMKQWFELTREKRSLSSAMELVELRRERSLLLERFVSAKRAARELMMRDDDNVTADDDDDDSVGRRLASENALLERMLALRGELERVDAKLVERKARRESVSDC